MNELANPLELCGFEFIEFVSKDGQLDAVFETIGFSKVAKHKSKNAYLWRQGKINIILNYQPESYAAYFIKNMALLPVQWVSAPRMRQRLLKRR